MPGLQSYKVRAQYRNPPVTGPLREDWTTTQAYDPLDAVARARHHTEHDTASSWVRALEVVDGETGETVIETDHPKAAITSPQE